MTKTTICWEIDDFRKEIDDGWTMQNSLQIGDSSWIVTWEQAEIRHGFRDDYCTIHQGMVATLEMGGAPEECHVAMWQRDAKRNAPTIYEGMVVYNCSFKAIRWEALHE